MQSQTKFGKISSQARYNPYKQREKKKKNALIFLPSFIYYSASASLDTLVVYFEAPYSHSELVTFARDFTSYATILLLKEKNYKLLSELRYLSNREQILCS